MLDRIIDQQNSIQTKNEEILEWQRNLRERENTLDESLKELSKTEESS